MPQKPIVFSASRIVDLAMWYPQALIDAYHAAVARGWDPHTLMVWTKFPAALLSEPLRSFLVDIQRQGVQVCLQLTITGMGGTDIEPGVPTWQEAIAQLPEVIDLIGDPRRIKARIDPQLRYMDAAGVVLSNYGQFEPIMSACAALGIKDFATSFVENDMHRKVTSRFEKAGYTLMAPDETERLRIAERMMVVAATLGVNLSACAVPGLPTGRCLDPDRLEELHPAHRALVHEKKKRLGRPLCGCCFDLDLGGWPPKKCPSGCLYCYATPAR